MLLFALVQAVVPAAADVVAPPLGKVIRHTTEEVRHDGRDRRTFRIARDVVFATEPAGYRATVTLRAASAEGSALEQQNYRIANAPMLDRTVVIHLDRAGRLRSVEDIAAVWDAWTAGLAATRPGRTAAEADAARAQLRKLPPERVSAIIGSMVTELFVPAAERVPVAARPVSLASPPPFDSVTLTGTGSAVAVADKLHIRLAAAGEAPATNARPAARITVTINREVDVASGLLVRSTRSEKVSAPGLALTSTSTSQLAW